MHIYICMYIYTHDNVFTHFRMYVHIHTYIYTYTHIYTERALVEAGPLKSLPRCRAKVESEYAAEEWPSTAHVLGT